MSQIRVGILGATGYTAFELMRLLLKHPEAQITALTTRSQDRPHVASVHPMLAGSLDLPLENLTAAEVAERADFVFSCLPHAASAEAVAPLIDAGRKVVDFSADYRLNDLETYRTWYEHEHPDPGRVGSTVYGLPELFRDAIRPAQLIANPGCYTSTAILALAPLLSAGLIAADDIIVDAKSGVSGAGRSPKLNMLYCETNESISAYGVGKHRHTPEMEQVLSDVSGQPVQILFTPHLTPMDRGILATIYARPQAGATAAQVMSALAEAYRGEPFVRVVENLPATKHVAGTNLFHVTARMVKDRVVVIAALDNLLKGASGVAMQNFNLMCGFAETTAL
ncbi:MAG: N-acetyl-gamma-glutamyl-phosphate reductase [Planctomycetales bacterium]|nr:N-acetyl-gamma-glutamyl-phosphate reductase [Planctomycetales bacterium]